MNETINTAAVAANNAVAANTAAACNTAVRPIRAKAEIWLETACGMCLAGGLFAGYLGLFHGGDAARWAALAAVALPIGCLFGAAKGKLADVAFWTAIGVAFGYLTVVRADTFDWTGVYVWPVIGAMVGAAAALCRDGRPFRRVSCCALAAVGMAAVYEFGRFGFRADLIADLVCATLGGALMGLGVELVRRYEARTAIPRHCLAVELIAAAILCHVMAITYIPGL